MKLFFSLFIILFFLLFIIIYFFPPRVENYTSEKLKSFQEIKSSIKTGDLLFLSGSTFGEKCCRVVIQSPFSHVAFLMKEKDGNGNDILYVIESDAGQGIKGGVRIMSLEDKLKKYKGERFGAIKRFIKSPERGEIDHMKILDIVKKYSHCELDNVYFTWFFSGFPYLLEKVKNEKIIFCSEFLTILLQGLGIISRGIIRTKYHPGDFFHEKVKFKDGNKYRKLEYFHF
jgi:hypothetical protein